MLFQTKGHGKERYLNQCYLFCMHKRVFS